MKTDLGVRGVEVIEVTRLRGREPGRIPSNSNNKPAPLLVRMRTAGQKWAIIGQAKKLRYAREEARRIMILPDLTIEEREIDRRLREELKLRREKGEKDIYISRGEIRRREGGGGGRQ